ncbi:hypothetical protein [Nocardia sp. NPDC052112]|uniref:hypothetical protein n=1 Tax=Nocardia sp. NPDC052112 TaxID=3155646 RepID=UPI00343B4F57
MANTSVVRGRVIEWLGDDAAWPIVDQLATEYIGQPYRETESASSRSSNPSDSRWAWHEPRQGRCRFASAARALALVDSVVSGI